MTKLQIIILTIVLYTAAMAAVVGGLYRARHYSAAIYTQPGQQEQWESFRNQLDDQHAEREDLREEIAAGTGQQTRRKATKSRSPRPPALELLENHFVACVLTMAFSATLLFGVIWGLFVGAVLKPGRTR